MSNTESSLTRGCDASAPPTRGCDASAPPTRGCDASAPPTRGCDASAPPTRGYDASAPPTRGCGPSPSPSSGPLTLPVEKLPTILQLMLKDPLARTHMLFLGPPGSGKTTAAQSFACALHGKKVNTFVSLLFLNSSDERSLETMRQKIYPFVESRMQSLFFTESAPPKVIIFDEAETLTDQAQCALRNLLQRSCKDVIIIFICNSLSHIHPQILNKFLIIPFIPVHPENLSVILNKPIPRLDSIYRRGDIRFFKQCPHLTNSISTFLFSFLHATSKEEVFSLCFSSGSPFRDRISWFLLFLQSLNKFDQKEFKIWSALTASETQPYLDESILKELLYKLWIQTVEKI